MNFLELKTKSNEGRKEYKKQFTLNSSDKAETLTILKGFIDDYVLIDFYSKFDPTETNTKAQFECVFYFKNGISIYEVVVPYEIVHDEYYQDNNYIGIYDVNNNCYSFEDENLQIDHKDYNPKKSMVKEIIEKYIESETEGYKTEPDYDSMKGGRDYENDLKNR